MATSRIEYSDLIAPDAISTAIKEVQGLNTALIAVLETQKKLLKNNSFKNTDDVKKFNAAVQQTATTSKALSAGKKEELALQKQLKAATDAEVAGKIRLQQVNKTQKDELKDLLVLQNKEAGTLDRLAAENRKLRRERQGLNLDTAKGSARLKDINKQLDQNNVRIKINSDALKKQRMNVGNYANGVQEGITATGLFSRQLFILQRIQAVVTLLTKKQTVETEALAGAQVVAAKTTGGVSKAMNILKIALISTGIGAIVVALGALIAAFLSTQRGADALTRVITPLKVVFETFVGFIQDVSFKVFDRLKAAIDDPKQALKDLGDVIVNNITNRFEAMIELGGAVSKVLTNLAKGNFEKVGEGLEDAANASIKLATGLDDVVGSVKEFAEETAKATAAALADGKKLTDLEIGLEKLRIKNTVPLQKQNFLYKAAVKNANDQTKSDAERVASLKEAEIALGNANEIRQSEIKAELAIAELKASFNDTDRDAQLEIEQIKARIFISDTEFAKKAGALVSLRTGIQKKQLLSIEKETIASNKRIAEENSLDEEDDDEAFGELQTELNAVKETNAKIIEEDKKTKAILLENTEEAIAEDIKLQTEAEEKKKELRKSQIEQVEQAAKLAGDALQQVSEKRIQGIEEEEEKTANAIERQERRSELGLENNLAFEQKKAAELEKQREDEAKKQEQRAKVLAYFNLFSEYAKAEPNTAAFKAAAQVAIAETVSGLFYEGTEKVEDDIQGKPMFSGRDGYVVRVDGSERIMTGAQNSKLGGISNDDLVELATNGNSQVGYAVGMDTKKLESKLDSVIKAVKSSERSVHWDSLGNRFETQIKNEVKKVTKHKKRIS